MSANSKFNQVQLYCEAFRSGSLKDLDTAGLLGRVIRGKKSEDFLTLSDDPDRKLIMLTDPEGLSALPGLTGFQILLRIGWDFDYAVKKVNDGYKMKLAVFREGGKARLATWENTIELVGLAYPKIAGRLKNFLPQLKITPFTDVEKSYGQDMSEVDRLGKNHPAYMTFDRYLGAADTLANARAFLYFTVHLRELYAGDGFTYDDKGNRGVREYLAINCPLTDLLDCETADFEVLLPAVCSKRSPRLAGSKGLPSYYHPDDVLKNYEPRLEEVTAEALTARLPHSSNDAAKTMLVLIDMQKDFVMPERRDVGGKVIQPAGSLRVGGAVDDIRRIVEYIYHCPEEITSVLLTLDQHLPFQIFYPAWWRDKNGQPPAPFTMITEDAVKNGSFSPKIMKDWSISYTEKLAATKQTPLIIWPYHCLIGSDGAAVVPALAEAIHWLSLTRGIQPIYLFKGTVPQTEHYGPFCPCVEVSNHPQGGLNTVMLDQIAQHDKILIAGEAEDFCVHEGMTQTLNYFSQTHRDALQKTVFLTDCTSMVFPQNRKNADEFLNEMEAKGIRVTTIQKLTA